MFIKNWFKPLFFSPILPNGYLKIITYYCRARYSFVSMCWCEPSSTEWMASPNYLLIHSVVYVYQNERTSRPFSRSVSCQRPHRPVVSFRVNSIKHSWFQTFALFWILNVFFWVFPRRLIVVCLRFGTLYLFHLHRLDMKYEVWAYFISSLWRWNR